jgi:hypothetical protein
MRASHLGLGVLLVFFTAGSVSAQREPVLDTDTDPADNQRIVTIRGCLDGRYLTATDMPEHLVTPEIFSKTGDRFRVVGDPVLLEELVDHSGHEVDIIGALLDDTGTTVRRGVERRIGDRTRVWIGGTRRPLVPENPIPDPTFDTKPPELDMRAVIHVNASCPLDFQKKGR